ncbi:M56 family metallopeptidase [Nocardioides pacificus]
MTPLLLGLLAMALAGPVPGVLARLPALRRTPRAAMLLWQSVALSAVLAALGAGLSLVTESLATGRSWRPEAGPAGWAAAGLALVVTLLVLGRLLLSGHRVGRGLRALRRRHREVLDLVARRDLSREQPGMRVLEDAVPVAYCLPGVTGARVVLSAGALHRLAPDEVEAVLAHERAHLAARHDLVLEAFSVLHRAFPRWVSSASALREVELLVEVLADRAAARVCGARALARALVALAEGRVPTAALGAASAGLVVRVRLLADGRPHRLQAAALVVLAVAVLALPTAFIVTPWLAALT